MSDRVIYVISHHPTEPTWKYRNIPLNPEPRMADYYKIGIADDPQKRLSAMSVGTPHHLEFVTTIESGNVQKVESELHSHFYHNNQRGEWFTLCRNDLNSLKGLDRLEPGELDGLRFYDYKLPTLYHEVMDSRGELDE